MITQSTLYKRLDPVSAELRNQFDVARRERRRRHLKMLTITVGSFYLSYTLVDIILLADVASLSLLLRFGIILPMMLGLFVVIRSDLPLRMMEAAAIAVVCAGNIIWCLVLISSHSPWVIHYFYAAIIFQMVVTIVVSPPFLIALGGTIACFAINYVAIWFLQGSSTVYVLHHLALYAPTMILTLMANTRMEAEDFRFFVQTQRDEMLQNELAKRNAELNRLSNTDALTGLANRRAADEQAHLLSQDARFRDKPLSVLLIDVDFFKAYNDHYGHQAGDQCLQLVARVMQSELRDTDFLARHGGEEFLALLPDCDGDKAFAIAERIRQSVERAAVAHCVRRDGPTLVTVSIGIASSPAIVQAEVAMLIRHADAALYAAKDAGRNLTRDFQRLDGHANGPRKRMLH
ncbi:MAG: GGDEF domain-containing protein [Phyllobacterium sp.]